eukprot:s1954_g13.t1
MPGLVSLWLPLPVHGVGVGVKLLKEANADKSPATDLMALLAVTRKIKDESDVYHCSVYQKMLQNLNFSCREAAEFLSIYLPITEEGSRPVTCEASAIYS